jgi:hypothetical protein
MTRRFALLVIFVSMLVIGAGYASAFRDDGVPRFMTYAFAIATAALMTAIIVLGAARKGTKLGILAWVFAFTFLVLAAGFSVALSETAVSTDRLYLGLPAGAAVIIYVVGLIPMAVLPIAYALTFDKMSFDEAELAELRRRLAELKQEPSAVQPRDVQP